MKFGDHFNFANNVLIPKSSQQALMIDCYV